MDIIGLTEKKLKLNTHEAIMQLKEWIGNVPSNGNGSVKSPTKNESDLSKIALLTKAFRYFENGLRTSKAGKEYLQSRNLVYSPHLHKKESKLATMPDRFTKGKTNTWSKVH
jgi:hypothetical protein